MFESIIKYCAMLAISFLTGKIMTSGRETNIQDLTESFSQCIITINFIDTHDYIPGLKVPVVINHAEETITFISRVHRRKYCFCVLNEILYPEGIIGRKYFTNIKLFIHALLTATGISFINYQHYRNFHYSNLTFSRFSALEYTYLIVVTEIEPMVLAKNVVSLLSYRIAIVYEAFIVKTTKCPTAMVVKRVLYICFYCLPQHSLVVDVSEFEIERKSNKSFTKTYLDMTANLVSQNGSRNFILFSKTKQDLEYPQNMKTQSLLSPFMINFNRSGDRLRMLDIEQALLFECMNFTHAVDVDYLGNLSYKKVRLSLTGREEYIRPVIHQNDPKFIRSAYVQAFTVTESYSFNFLTCAFVFRPSIGNVNSVLAFYFAPLEYPVWIALIFVLVCLPCIMTFMARIPSSLNHKQLQFGVNEMCFNVELVVSSLLENGKDFDIKRSFNTNMIQGPVYILLAGWALSLLVFNNVYKGVLTSNELLQLPLECRWQAICDLVNHNVTFVNFFRSDKENKYVPKIRPNASRARPAQTYSLFFLAHENTKKIKHKNPMKSSCEINWRSNSIFFLRRDIRFAYDILSRCDRTVLVDRNDIIDQMLYWFNIESLENKFVKGPGKFLHGNLGLFIFGHSQRVTGRIHRRLRLLIESGILKLFQDWFKPEGYEFFKRASALKLEYEHSNQFKLKYKTVQLYPDMVPMIVISSLGIGIAVLSFICEKMYSIKWLKFCTAK